MHPIRAFRLALFALAIAAGLGIALLFPILSRALRARLRGAWSRALLWVLGVRIVLGGEAKSGAGACLVVSNHVSWLDAVAISAAFADATFVCKDDVASWPLVGWLLGRAGTLFLRRGSAHAARRAACEMAGRLRAGARIAIFPEGTTTPGDAVLPFHAGLFEAAVQAGCAIQPVAIAYSNRAAVYAGGTGFGESLDAICGARGLEVTLALLPSFSGRGLERREAARRARGGIVSCLGHRRVAEPSRGEPILRAA